MDRLTFEAWLRTVCFQAPTPEAHDLAKCAWEASQSLSQEAVLDEALDSVVNRLGKEYVGEEDTAHNAAVGYCIGAVIALKREPNAAAPEGPAHNLPCWPVDGPAPAAPDVATEATLTAEWLEAFAEGLIHPESPFTQREIAQLRKASALLAKLGQGWALEPRELKLLIDYHDAKGCEAEAMGVNGSVRYHDKRRAHYESLLPPAPGASDD